ncbi:PepSY domain-containing protein [Streptomyces sp. NPDC085946]|uniref:PepSY domain-containing protein n=1 Tax=Streptomyces sp. NPDC085946 TaxID=3365744 RepID=UPI0037D7C5A6
MKRNIVIAAVTAAALIGGGTATALAVADDDGDDTARQTAQARPSDDDDGAEEAAERRARADVSVTAPEAVAAALKHAPGTAVSAELDDEDDGGGVSWQVDVLGGGDTWHSVRIDPGTGKVLGAEKEREDDTAEVRAALKGTSVTAAEAARAAAGKGTVTSVDLEESGSPAWEVETGADREWRVDARTGKVTADRSDED